MYSPILEIDATATVPSQKTARAITTIDPVYRHRVAVTIQLLLPVVVTVAAALYHQFLQVQLLILLLILLIMLSIRNFSRLPLQLQFQQ